MGPPIGREEVVWDFLAAHHQAEIVALSVPHSAWVLLEVFHVFLLISCKSSNEEEHLQSSEVVGLEQAHSLLPRSLGFSH